MGQASAHAPQLTQAFSFINLCPSEVVDIQPTKQISSQIPHPTHNDSLIFLAINTSFYKVCLQEVTVISKTLVKKENFSFIISNSVPSVKYFAVPSNKKPVPMYLYPITS